MDMESQLQTLNHSLERSIVSQNFRHLSGRNYSGERNYHSGLRVCAVEPTPLRSSHALPWLNDLPLFIPLFVPLFIPLLVPLSALM